MKLKQHAIALAFSLPFAVAPAFAQDTATITQLGTNSAASISQVGNQGTNDASIAQGEFVVDSRASISQSGVRNATASIGQGTGLAGFGDSLDAVIDQRDSGSVTASVNQDGLFHKAYVLQAGSYQSDVSINQRGNIRGEGDATVTVLDSANTSVVIDSVGVASSVVNQSNVVNGSVVLNQTAILTAANINQHDASNVTARVSQFGIAFADIEQTGDGGMVIADQSGSDNVLNVLQDGGLAGAAPGSVASITQLGIGNTANVTQVGRGFVATVAQVGDGNTATIYQHY